MKPLFADYRRYAYIFIFGLLALSFFFVFSPTGLITFVSGNDLIDAAFLSTDVKNFAADNPDFRVIIQELTADKIVSLQQAYPQLYSNLPDAKIYQMILDANEKALIILLNEEAVFKVWEASI